MVMLESERREGKLWTSLFMRFWSSVRSSPPSARSMAAVANTQDEPARVGGVSVAAVAKLLFPERRRLRLDPSTKLYFPYEPGKQVRSAVRIKNTSKSHVAFKFQTTAPKSCFMRPPGGILSSGESIVVTVFKYVEHPENNEKSLRTKSKVKFKIMSLKLKSPVEYVPELFDEQRSEVLVEQILSVVFLDANCPNSVSDRLEYFIFSLNDQLNDGSHIGISPTTILTSNAPESLKSMHLQPANMLIGKRLDKLKIQLAEADAALEVRKKPPEDTGPRIVGEGLVIDEWKVRREKYLARQQVEVIDSL